MALPEPAVGPERPSPMGSCLKPAARSIRKCIELRHIGFDIKQRGAIKDIDILDDQRPPLYPNQADNREPGSGSGVSAHGWQRPPWLSCPERGLFSGHMTRNDGTHRSGSPAKNRQDPKALLHTPERFPPFPGCPAPSLAGWASRCIGIWGMDNANRTQQDRSRSRRPVLHITI